MPLSGQNSQVSAEEYNSVRSEYGTFFEKLSASDRSVILAVLASSLYNFTLNDPFLNTAAYNAREALLSENAKRCCVRLMSLTFEHTICACTALLSQLNLPHE